MRRFFAAVIAVAFATGVALSSAQSTTEATQEAFRPKTLSDEDRALYAEIFSLQEAARWSEADAKIAALGNDALLGYVKLERYLHPKYKSSFAELKEWMAYYADHPDADRIYALARRKQPRGAAPALAPIPRKWRAEPAAALHPDLERDYAQTSRPLLTQIEGRVRFLCKREQAGDALKEIERHRDRGAITQRQFDRMRSWIAASYFYQGYKERALEIAEDVTARNGDSAVLAYWIAGLIEFRGGDMGKAHDSFSAMARTPQQEDALRAAAGFWAARTALADGHGDEVPEMLEIAAQFPFTFYGQLALAQLGRDYAYNWTPPPLTSAGYATLAAREPAVNRAIALLEVGRTIEADLEFRWINGRIDPSLATDLFAVEAAFDLPAAQLDFALQHDDRAFEAGLFPLPAYAPTDGFKTDRALIYALMRQESKFKVEATSRVGARGLMQLMPRTASYVAKDRSLHSNSGRDKLYDPAVNLAIGQQYVNHLINTTAEGDLFNMALAYNGGPGNLRRWKRDLAIEDPLLFIESIPNPESRDFVERVLTNFWVYRQRLGQKPHSRDKVAAGELPLHEALDEIAAAEGN